MDDAGFRIADETVLIGQPNGRFARLQRRDFHAHFPAMRNFAEQLGQLL